MVWTRASLVLFIFCLFGVNKAFAQESLWKTFNDAQAQTVPSYSGGLSPFPQKQKRVEEIEFETVSSLPSIDDIETEAGLSDEEKKLMLTASILAEIKAFLAEESVFVPNLEDVVVEATAKSQGKYKALIKGRWLTMGDTLTVPVDEAIDALNLLERLRDVDQQIAETVENAVLDRAEGHANETVEIVHLQEDQVVLQDSTGQEHILNFIKAPY